MTRWRDAVDARRHAAGGGDLGTDLGAGQHTAVAGLGSLAELELDHLDLVAPGVRLKFLGAEGAVAVAAAEITGADFPDDVAAVFTVIRTVAALPRIVGKIAFTGAGIERADRVGAQRAETHRRNFKNGSRIGFCAIRSADDDAERLLDDVLRRDRMVEPLVAAGIDVVLRAERPLVQRPPGALTNKRALVARERRAVLFAFEKILPNLGTDLFENKADMRGQRIIAQHRVPGLKHVDRTDDRQCNKHDERNFDKERSKPVEEFKPECRGN